MGRRLVRAAVALVALGSACREDSGGGDGSAEAAMAIAQSTCTLKLSCECEAGGAAGDCEAALTQDWQTISSEAAKAGLTFDPACADAIIQQQEDFACRLSADLADLECRTCKLYFGPKGAGQECDPFFTVGFDNCAQGLGCFESKCGDPCVSAKEGQTCIRRGCEDGHACQLVSEGEELTTACVRLRAMDEACSDTEPCEDGLWCHPNDVEAVVCQPAPEVGQACVDTCQPGAFCTAEFLCESLRADGDACGQDVQCLSGTCTQSLCVPPAPHVCGR